MANESKTYEYPTPYGTTEMVQPKLNTYANNNNLYIGLDYLDREFDCWSPYADVTVNVGKLPFLESAIDINNNGMAIVEFLEKNGFGHLTAKAIPSGFCMFPVFKFNEEKLKEIDGFEFAQYAKAHGQEQRPLDAVIKEASACSNGVVQKSAMTAIRQGYDEFSLFPNEDLEGITLVHGGGQVKVGGVLYELQRPLSMRDCMKLDAITNRPKRHKVDDYFPRRDECR